MYDTFQELVTSIFFMLIIFLKLTLKFWKCRQIELWTGWWNMRSQIGAFVISLDISINGACCFVPGEYCYIFALSNIYMIYFEAMQHGVRKRDSFIQEKLFCFQELTKWHSFLSQSFLTTFWIVFCLSRTRCISVCFDLAKIQHRH